MRTIEDLREALMSLESEAPAIDELLAGPARVQRVKQPRRWVLPAAAAGLTAAVVLGATAIAALRSGGGEPAGASLATSRTAVGPARLLPFRLRSSLPQLTLVYVRSDTRPTRSYGTAVVVEYGMEVTIDVRIAVGQPARSASASRTHVGGVEGWIDASCGVRAAPSSAAPASSSAATSTAPAFNPACSLSYDSGPWQVSIYVAGPGGGSRKITSDQFLQIGRRLQLAAASDDSATWFTSDKLLPS